MKRVLKNVKFDWIAAGIAIVMSLCPRFSQAEETNLDLAWNHYVSTLQGLKLQPGCSPKRFSPPAGVAVKGTAILLHGFSACPQQYFEWANMLTQKGFEVLLPLLPGHGHQQVLPGADDHYDVPNLDNWQEYDEFADQINFIAQAAPGIKVIGGLSVGAAVVVDAVNKAPDLYDRELIISPYFESANHFDIPNTNFHWAPIKTVLTAEEVTGALADYPMDWGDSCVEQMKLGRHGLCQFDVGNIGAITKFGKSVLKATHPVSHTETQVIFVEEDTVADNGDQISMVRKLGDTPKVAACTLPKGVNHSCFSRFDFNTPGESKWWIPALLKHGTEFIVDGQSMPLAGASIVKHFNQCDVGCSREDAAKNNCSLAN